MKIFFLLGSVAVSICFICLITIIVLFKTNKRFKSLLLSLIQTYPNVAEIIRFLIVGGIATAIDLFVMGLTLYLVQPDIYNSFLNVFVNAPTASTFATILGTTLGFIVGLLINYILSILFVFINKEKGKSAKGFIMFAVLSLLGLLINAGGTYLLFALVKIHQWVVKIIMIAIVLCYNYISKKLLIFNKK